MRVAVTGSSGLLGTQVLRRLLENRQGNFQAERVVAIDLRPPRLLGKKLEIVLADVRDPAIADHLENCDALIHLAFVVTQALPRGAFDSINVGGSKNVFAAAARAGVKSIVYSSSVAAYGVVAGHPKPIVEDTPRRLQQSFAYAAAKYRVEEFLDQFEQEHPDIAVARLRPSVLIGDGMDHPLGASLRRGVIPDFGAPSLPIVWNEDVADAVVLALEQRARGAFILSAREQLPAAELARAAGLRHLRVRRSVALAVARVSPLLAKLGLLQKIDRAWIESSGVDLVFESEKARRQLGWKPRCDTSAEVMKRYAQTVPGKLDRRLARFLRLVDLKSRFSPPLIELKGFRSRISLVATGPGGGDIDITVDGGRIRARPGVPRPPDAILTLPATLLLELLAGSADFATAQLTGRLRVEGQGHAVMVLGGMVAQFRAAAQAPGVRGRIGKFLVSRVLSAPAPTPRIAP